MILVRKGDTTQILDNPLVFRIRLKVKGLPVSGVRHGGFICEASRIPCLLKKNSQV